MQYWIGVIFVFLFPNSVMGQTDFAEYGGAIFIKAIDARTIVVDLPEYPLLIGEHIKVRFNGILTPNLKGKCNKESKLAIKAKKFTENFFKNAEIIDLTNIKRGIYFQIVADVMVNDEEFIPHLLKKGYAIKTSKKNKTHNWCK